MLEKMDAFFEARLDGYEAHMLDGIKGAREFYPFTAALLPRNEGAQVLDLGCGTGLELEYYFAVNPEAHITGIDLSAGMLNALKTKFPGKQLRLICGSYFDADLGNGYDAAVSVESLHHFTAEEKTRLYTKLLAALKPGGCFVLTDYFASDNESEWLLRQELVRLKKEEGLCDEQFYHFDTPLTVEHEIEALLAAGFQRVDMLGRWEATHTLKAIK